MARYGSEYGREYDAWGEGGQWGRSQGYGADRPRRPQWGQGGAYGQTPQGYRAEPDMYDRDYYGADRYGYEDWGERYAQRNRERWLGGTAGGYGGYQGGGYQGGGFQNGPQGGYQGGGYPTHQRPYGEDYGFSGENRGYRAGPVSGYGTGYGGGGYESGYTGGYGAGRSRRGGQAARASEIMTENPEVVTPDTTLAEAASRMKELDVGIIPVVESRDDRRLRGVITDRDIVVRALAAGKDGKAKVSDCMTAHVETVNKNDDVQQVLRVMETQQVRRVPVTDREGRVVGIIAQADLAVDYAEGDVRRERMVEHAIERISEPARPQHHRTATMHAGSQQPARSQQPGYESRETRQAEETKRG